MRSREPDSARAVVDSWRHADGDEYPLHAWVVMPNHVHVLVEPLSAQKIGDIVGAWKSVSVRKILRCITANAAGLTYSEATGGRSRSPEPTASEAAYRQS